MQLPVCVTLIALKIAGVWDETFCFLVKSTNVSQECKCPIFRIEEDTRGKESTGGQELGLRASYWEDGP